MSHSLLDPVDLCTFRYTVTHVFCPLQLAGGDGHNIRNDYSLAGAVASAMRLYSDHVDQANLVQWHSITRMMDYLQDIVQFEGLDRSQIISQLSSMDIGGKLSNLHTILETHNV